MPQLRGWRRRRPPAPARGLPAGFGVLWSTVALDLVGFGIVIPLLPLYAHRLGAGPTAVGVLLAAFSAAQLLGAPLLGRLSDRVGRKPVLVVSLVGTALGSLLTGVAGSLWLLLVARVVDGASGGSVAVAQAAAGDLVAPHERTRAFGLLGAAYGVGFVVGPALGGLAALGGARLPFFVAAVVAGVNAVMALRRLPETSPGRARGTGPAGAARPGLGLAGVRRGLQAAAVPVTVTMLVVVAFSAFEVTFPLFARHRLGLGLADVGAVFAFVGLIAAGVQGGLVHRVVGRVGEAACVRLGAATEGAGLLVLAVAHSRLALLVPLVLVTAGQGLCTPVLSALVVARVDPTDRGASLGSQQGCAALARVVGPVLGGGVVAAFGVGAGFVAGAVVLALALGLALALRGAGRESPGMVVEGPPRRLPLGNKG